MNLYSSTPKIVYSDVTKLHLSYLTNFVIDPKIKNYNVMFPTHFAAKEFTDEIIQIYD